LGRLEVGWEKVARWSTKAAISLKHVKVEEKLLLGAYRKSPMLFPTVPFPTPYGLLFPKIGVLNSHPKLQSLLSQEWVKLRTSNLARTIIGSIRTEAEKIFWRKGSVSISRDCPNFLGTPIISGSCKATNFKFCTHIYRLNRNKSPLKISGKVAVGVVSDSRKFSGHPYIGCITRSSLR